MDAPPSWLTDTPPDHIAGRSLSLTHWTAGDADAQTDAVVESIAELRPWMPWADGYDAEASRAYLQRAVADRDAGSQFQYAIRNPDGRVVGCIGLHPRIGRGGIELGYWVRTDATGQGYALRAAALATDTCLALGGVTFVEIHHDQANEISGRIPRRLGYRHVDTVTREPRAPGETGTALHWRMTADAYAQSAAARIVAEETAGINS